MLAMCTVHEQELLTSLVEAYQGLRSARADVVPIRLTLHLRRLDPIVWLFLSQISEGCLKRRSGSTSLAAWTIMIKYAFAASDFVESLSGSGLHD
jgi:hypothetical protein